MAKIDKSQYTKEEFRRIKEQRRQEKEQKKREQALEELSALGQEIESSENYHPHNPLVKDQNYVLCLKHGDKYSSQYVNTLYSMVKRNLTIPFTFACLTDNRQGIDKDILCLDLPKDLTGWWCKPYMYSNELPLNGTILYMDLDVVISGNLNKLFDYEPGKWCVIRDFTRAMQPNWQKYNSSVIRFEKGQLDFVWQEFIQNPKSVMRRHFGDQDWLWEKANGMAQYFPDKWIQSWKWEVRKDKTFEPGGVKGSRKLKTIENVKPRVECCVTVFHGDPNPHNCKDPWVIDNWK